MQTYKNTKRVWGPRDRINRRRGKRKFDKKTRNEKKGMGPAFVNRKKKKKRKTFKKKCLITLIY